MNMYVSFGSLVTSHLIIAFVVSTGSFFYGYSLGKKKG